MAVEIVHFNPRVRRDGPLGRLLPRRRLNNFGDLIGPVLVDRILSELGVTQPAERRRLVAVGSIMKLTRPGDVVWGAGVNGKSMDTGAAPRLDVRAVRGPHTRRLLREAGTEVPEVYGDPALLWSRFWPAEYYGMGARGDDRVPVSVVPNFHDRWAMRGGHMIDPLQRPHSVIRDIVRSDFVCGSSLHGVIIAESFGIPARLVKPGAEPSFKYDDYYAGTGRDTYGVASTVEEAIAMGGERPPVWDPVKLLEAFPADIYQSSTREPRQSGAMEI